jgi:hypothetical protein
MGLSRVEQERIIDLPDRTLEQALINFLERREVQIPQREYGFSIISKSLEKNLDLLRKIHMTREEIESNSGNYTYKRENSFVFYQCEHNKEDDYEFLELAKNREEEDEENVCIRYDGNQIVVLAYNSKNPTPIEIKRLDGGVEALEIEISYLFDVLYELNQNNLFK